MSTKQTKLVKDMRVEWNEAIENEMRHKSLKF